ncbi:MAG: hypothetical protein VXY34_10050, partial [Bdellovibrionota bacterium]|nr:hypothetical protein [Bdellovibrionota bacterium]MEC8625150.1 hypothetical protein [Bdellovibrionota bacterium]
MTKPNWKTDFQISDEAVKDLSRITIKFMDITQDNLLLGLQDKNELGNSELIRTKVRESFGRYDEEAKYIAAVANRIIHFEHLLAEIDYAFSFLSSSPIPDCSSQPCDHFIYCQRTIDFYVTSIKDRSLQLICSVFRIPKTKSEISERVLRNEEVPKDVWKAFEDMRDSIADFQNRKNIFLHRESSPSFLLSKDTKLERKEFDERLLTLKNEWEACLPMVVSLVNSLVSYYSKQKSILEK